LSLSKKEEEYFETIVAFDHAKTHEEKDKYFNKMLILREYKSIKLLEKEQYIYFSHWYVPVVRELVTHPQYRDDPSWIAEQIIPPISKAKVCKAIKLLEDLGMIKKEGSKWIQTTNNTISTPSEVISLAVVKYHKDIISLARESIDRFKLNERDIRSVTIGLSKDGFEHIKKRLEAFWKELLDFSNTQNNIEQVMQINMQAFPLTKQITQENKNE